MIIKATTKSPSWDADLETLLDLSVKLRNAMVIEGLEFTEHEKSELNTLTDIAELLLSTDGSGTPNFNLFEYRGETYPVTVKGHMLLSDDQLDRCIVNPWIAFQCRRVYNFQDFSYMCSKVFGEPINFQQLPVTLLDVLHSMDLCYNDKHPAFVNVLHEGWVNRKIILEFCNLTIDSFNQLSFDEVKAIVKDWVETIRCSNVTSCYFMLHSCQHGFVAVGLPEMSDDEVIRYFKCVNCDKQIRKVYVLSEVK